MSRKFTIFALVLAALALVVSLLWITFPDPGMDLNAETAFAIRQAKIDGERAKSLNSQTRKYDLSCLGAWELCDNIAARAEKNPRLNELFLQAKDEGVSIHPTALFSLPVGIIAPGVIIINTRFSDEQIIVFLEGE